MHCRLVPLLALALFACTPETVDTGDTPTPTPTPPPPTEDTGHTGSPYLDVGTLTLSAQFGFDAATGAIVPVTIDGTSLPPAFEINLGSATWNGSFQSPDYCTVAYDLTGLTATTTDTEPWLELTIPTDAPTVTNCELDPAEWGDDPSEAFRPAAFGVTVGTLSQEVRDWLEPQLAPGEIDDFHGGLLQATDLLGQDEDFVYTNVYAVDAAFAVELVDQDLVTVPAADLRPAVPSAWYTVNAGTLWTLQ